MKKMVTGDTEFVDTNLVKRLLKNINETNDLSKKLIEEKKKNTKGDQCL